MPIAPVFQPPSNLARLLIVVGSVLIAAWTYWIDPVVNRDAVLYVSAADAFSHGEFAYGFAIYKWPFYSLCIALLAKLTPFNPEQTAYLLNAVLRGLGGIAFLNIMQLLTANRAQIWLAVAIYLLFPGLNEVQSMIIRDHGYICWFLWMLFWFLRQLQQPHPGHLCGFIVCGVLATAFRFEGMVYVIGLLLFYLWHRTQTHVSTIWYLRALLVGGVVLGIALVGYAAFLWFYGGSIASLHYISAYIIDYAKDELQQYIAGIESAWLRALLDFLTYPILLFTPLVRMLWGTLEVLTVVYLLILLYGWWHRPLLPLERRGVALYAKAWRFLIILNILVLAAFVMLRQLINDRYSLSLVLLLMLPMPFILSEWLSRARQSRRAWVTKLTKPLLVTLLLLNAAEGLDRFTNKAYLKQAGLHIKQQLRPGDLLITNDNRVEYYVGNRRMPRYPDYSWQNIKRQLKVARDKPAWIALYFTPEDQPQFEQLHNLLPSPPEHIYSNKKGFRVVVYGPRVDVD